jgi:hypothetical protein
MRKKTRIVSDRSRQIALPWPATTQLSLDILCGKFEPLEMIPVTSLFRSIFNLTYRGTAIDNRTNRGTMALAIGSHSKKSTKRRHDRGEMGQCTLEPQVAGLLNGERSEE